MIIDERMLDFIASFDSDENPVLKPIEDEALRDDVPIIRKPERSLLKVLLNIIKPRQILEIGSAIGFSAVLMASQIPEESHITTIENYPPRIKSATKNIAESGFGDKITLLQGDAEEVIKGLSGQFDFVFIDAAKGQYKIYFDEVLRLLPVGGVVLCDNVLQEGDIIESRYIVKRRNRTIHGRMREFLHFITHDERFETSILPVGDGVSISVRKG